MGSIVAIPLGVTLALISTKPSDVVFWWKWIVSYVYIQFERRFTKRRFDLYNEYVDHDPYVANFICPTKEITLESPLDESELYTHADEVFCYGVNSKSEYLVVKVSRNVNNEAEAWIYLKLSNGKVYQLKESAGFQRSCCEQKVFTCGGLQMHYSTPMRQWRIFFNGLLKETDENDSTFGKIVHVKFALLWKASTDEFDFTTDINAKTLAAGLAEAKWMGFAPPLKKFKETLNMYAQCGAITGKISIEDIEEDYEIYLFGERIRFIGEKSVLLNASFFHALGQTLRTGSFVHIVEISIENVVKNLVSGFYVQPHGLVGPIEDATLTLKNLNEKNTEDDVQAKFRFQDVSYILKGNYVEKQTIQDQKSWDAKVKFNCFDYELNSLKCAGIVIKGSISKPIANSSPKKVSSQQISESEDVPLVVNFFEKLCRQSEVTGGKGSSLGILTELSKDLKNFIVPDGIVVTTKSYELFLTEDIIQRIKDLESVLYGKTEGDVKEACQRVMDEINESNIPDKLSDAIRRCLIKAFPEENGLKFAIRSSATGEDTEQMSAAGQMETFLGVIGIEEILSSVKKCWASQFSFIAVQYKRQNGQIINSPMAVVIQKMIPCDVAGVLFTCDPLTGNPTNMSITANYGLGESVVSASEEPDTIELKRDIEGQLTIKSKTIGAKCRRIVLQDVDGTNIEEVSEEERRTCCLSDDMALRLGELAIKIERHYRSDRDIEWGFWNNNLYIFQSRPVTSGTGETDFEIDHETDAPLRIENEYFSMANVGEVMPGSLSPLGLDILMKFFRTAFQRCAGGFTFAFKPRYFLRGIMTIYNHVMFFCVDLLERMDLDKGANDAMLVGLFGRIIEDEELFQTVRDRFGEKKRPFYFGLVFITRLFSRLFQGTKVLKKTTQRWQNYRIPIERFQTSQELFEALLNACTDLNEAMGCHMINTESSSIWNMFIFNLLKKVRGELSSDVYSDLSKLLTTSSEVESADVPAALENLALHIAKEKKPEEFKKMDTKEIIKWLESSPTNAGIQYRTFLNRHAHRCLREFDIRSKTWGTDQTTLIQMLKNLVGTPSKNKKVKKGDEINKMISDLGLELDFKTRLLLKFLIPRSRQGVQNREKAKSLLIKSQDAWRKGYQQLSKMMVLEGRIPDEDLLFFITLDEIKELLQTRSPAIISRANHRRRRYPIIDKYIFPEIMKGFPKPINTDDNTILPNSEENFSMKGIPVSQGTVKAYVRIAITLEEAAKLQPGEILLTYSTDIGWSPYFPILAGVVTELGGLISHGAVVSREYGLPCIAGLHGATRQFQTGDYVLLDGNKGILQRLPKPEISETEL